MPKPPFNQDTNQITPKPELEKRTRRKFSTDYNLCILAEADACQHGELGALLRRESLYSNHLRDWRAEFRKSGVQGLAKTAPGPAASKTVEQRRIEQLEKENSRPNRKLAKVRQEALAAQFQRHPERFVKGKPKVIMPPQSVYINPISGGAEPSGAEIAVNFPTLPAARESQVRYTLTRA